MPDFTDDINEAADQYGVPRPLLYNLIGAESRFNPNAVNPLSGASGLGQFLPSTAADVGLKDPFDPTANINAAAKYLSGLESKTGSWLGAVKAYGGGLSGYQREASLGNQYARNLLGYASGLPASYNEGAKAAETTEPPVSFSPISMPPGVPGVGAAPQQITVNMPGTGSVPGMAQMNPMMVWSILQAMMAKTHQFTPVDYDPWAVLKKEKT